MDYQWKKLYRLSFLIFKKVKNKNKYIEIFIKSLSIDKKKFTEKLKYNDIPEWDSIGHMTLMSELEDGFNISIDTDINSLSDSGLVIEAVSENYSIKSSIFKDLDMICNKDTILASNTSSIYWLITVDSMIGVPS